MLVDFLGLFFLSLFCFGLLRFSLEKAPRFFETEVMKCENGTISVTGASQLNAGGPDGACNADMIFARFCFSGDFPIDYSILGLTKGI